MGGFTPANDGNGEPEVNNATHGMNSAGIIAASHNDIGVRGVAPGVNLLSVNIFAGGTTNGDIADGIQWAINNGADVLSNSWSFSFAPCNFTNIDIEIAIQDAVTNGRNEDGAVIVFSSGNDGGCVNYPARNENVISVGAVDNQGNLFNYSSRGPELDLVAPSGETGYVGNVRTLDRIDGAGRHTGNYEDSFGGTSASCPVVSGVAALVLSGNPNLTQQEVRDILTNTATDMGVGGFDNNFGNGRVNAEAAVKQALPRISGSATLCLSENYNVPVIIGTNVQWSASPSYMVNISNNGDNSITVTPSNNSSQGKFTLTANIDFPNGGSISISKDVQFDAVYTLNTDGTKNYMGQSYSYPYSNSTRSITVHSDAPNTTYTWDMFPTNIQWQSVHNTATFYINSPGNYILTCTAVSECGESMMFFSINIDDNYHYNYSIFPNPASSQITVENTSFNKSIQSYSSLSNTSDSKGNILIYNFNGALIQTKKYSLNSQSFSLDVSMLKPGKYFMKIGAAREEETHQIVIRR